MLSIKLNRWVISNDFRLLTASNTTCFCLGRAGMEKTSARCLREKANPWSASQWIPEGVGKMNDSPYFTQPRKIPWTEKPGRLQSMGSLRVGHEWATSLSLFTFMHWRRQWQPTPALFPGESQGRQSLVGCRLWVHTESDMTEAT